jgi:hypothetical protein
MNVKISVKRISSVCFVIQVVMLRVFLFFVTAQEEHVHKFLPTYVN